MNEDDDDESGIGKMYNRQEAKNSNISFIWGSPLHKMIDIKGTDPYDTVDLVDLNAATESKVSNCIVFLWRKKGQVYKFDAIHG